MLNGFYVLNFFAAVWAIFGLSNANLSDWSLIIPPLMSGVIIVYAKRNLGTLPDVPPTKARRIARLVARCSGAEGIAILIVVGVLNILGRPVLIFPAIGIIVGLHFFPLARYLPEHDYYMTGIVLVVLGLIAIIFPSLTTISTLTFGSALTLWLTSFRIFSHIKALVGNVTGSGQASSLEARYD